MTKIFNLNPKNQKLMWAKSINPATGELMKEYNYITEAELETKISKANEAFKTWKKTSFEERKNLFYKLYDVMMEKKEELAKLDTLEMGMLLKDAYWDVEKSASNAKFFADKAADYLKPKDIDSDWVKARIVYEPLGIIFSIMPWNYPYNQVLRSAVPNIMAWNVVLMKHASNVPQVAEKLEELFKEAWFPEWVYTNLFIPHDFTEKIIGDKRIAWANTTWSETVGRELGSLSWRYFKPSILELGWSDAFILWNVSDIDKAVIQAIKWRFSNHGQKCNCSKRFIIIEKHYEEFVEKFTNAVKTLKIWDPMESTTNIGPLAKPGSVRDIDSQVQDSIAAWAKLTTWWHKVGEVGNFYSPTVLVDVKPWMRVFDEETFWPVAAVIKVADIKEAVEMANNSVFGLGCSVFSDSQDELDYVAANVEVGNVAINKIVTSYANLPYGWIKASGYGKELAENGLKAFMNEKVIIL